MQIESQHVIAAIVALASAVAYLYAAQLLQAKRTERKLAHCEKGHEQANRKLIELTGDFKELKGKQDGVSQFAKEVLKAVASGSQRAAQREPKGDPRA